MSGHHKWRDIRDRVIRREEMSEIQVTDVTADEVPTIEQLQTQGITIKDLTRDSATGVVFQPRRIVIELNDAEYERIGGTPEALKDFANKLSDLTNFTIATEY